ncbi:MAG: hypothetical protein LBV53_02460 [Mycoplasmataceae bacterium]|jgi:hypothetical protein|nr:hypothetical protein [Mycoplasmataceae bacterium]
MNNISMKLNAIYRKIQKGKIKAFEVECWADQYVNEIGYEDYAELQKCIKIMQLRENYKKGGKK